MCMCYFCWLLVALLAARAFLLLCFGENYSFPILIVQFFFIEKKLPPPPFCSTRFITELKCCCTNYLSERVLELSVKLFSPCNLAVWRLILQTGMWFLKGLYIYGHLLCHCDNAVQVLVIHVISIRTTSSGI